MYFPRRAGLAQVQARIHRLGIRRRHAPEGILYNDRGVIADAKLQKQELLPGAFGDVVSQIPIFEFGLPAILSLYFDWFSSFMQAFIFCMLTMMYIGGAAEADG